MSENFPEKYHFHNVKLFYLKLIVVYKKKKIIKLLY